MAFCYTADVEMNLCEPLESVFALEQDGSEHQEMLRRMEQKKKKEDKVEADKLEQVRRGENRRGSANLQVLTWRTL